MTSLLRSPSPIAERASLPAPATSPATRVAPAPPPRSPRAAERESVVPPFRRSPAAQHRKRPSRALRTLRRTGPVLAAVALAAALGGWLLTSPRFDLAEVVVTTSGEVAAGWVESELAPLVGRNLVRLPLAEVEQRVRSHPWIAGVEIHKLLPRRLEVTVREREPHALVAVGEELWYADAAGGLIVPVGNTAGAAAAVAAWEELPRVRDTRPTAARTLAERHARGVPGALAILEELAACRPGWAAGLVEIEVVGERDFAVTTRTLPFPLLLERGQVASRSARLAELLPEIVTRYQRLAAVDLRFSRRIVLRPAPLSPAEATAAPGGTPRPAAATPPHPPATAEQEV